MAPFHSPSLLGRQAIPPNAPLPPGVQTVPLQPNASPTYVYDNVQPALPVQTIPTSATAVYLTGPPPPGVTVIPVSSTPGLPPLSAGPPIVYETVTAPGTRNAYGYGPPPVYMTTAGVFGQADPASQRQSNATGSDSSTSIAVGVVFAVIVLLFLGVLRYRYWQYRRNGGTGTRWEAFFGKSMYKEQQKAKAEQKDTWKNWPMLRYVPKYTFGDMVEDNEKKEKEEEERKKKMAAAAKK